MTIAMQSGTSANEIERSQWDHVIHGEAVDARGAAAIDFASTNNPGRHHLQYTPSSFQLIVNGNPYSTEEPEMAFAWTR